MTPVWIKKTGPSMIKKWIALFLVIVSMALSNCNSLKTCSIAIQRINSAIRGRTFSSSAPCTIISERLQNNLFHIPSRTAHSLAREEDTSLVATAYQDLNKDDIYSPHRPYFPIYYNDVYEVILPKNHRFPMEKYRKVRELVQKWMAEMEEEERELISCEFRVSPLATFDELTTTHSPEYVNRFLTGDQTEAEIRNVGFPWSESGVNRALSSVGGTVAAATSVCDALRQRQDDSSNLPVWSAHVAGGTHHAFRDRGEGFCVFSDIAVAANVILRRYPELIKRVLIVDLDVHQGNGNAVLFQNRSDVSTFSMHCDANYFSPKQQSDLDVELPVGCSDETYLVTLKHWLSRIEKLGGNFDIIFFQAGVDVLEHDRLGRMSLTSDGVKRRNDLVFEFARKMNLPLVITMGGGYPRTGEPWTPILEAHANVYFQACQYLSSFAPPQK